MPNIGTVPITLRWNMIEWRIVLRKVRQIQSRIVKYLKQGKLWKAKKLQRLLRNSFIAALLAVRRVTSNKGKKTAGVDGKLLDTPAKKWGVATNVPKSRGYKPLPLKRIEIPKKNGKKRPLGIPTMTERVTQAIHLQALEPIAEFTADGNSYGFRPCRSTADAIESCFQHLSRKSSPEWILDADIKGCFDNIRHEWLVRNIPTDKIVLQKWLKSGFLLGNKLYPTTAGTPQGGIISPVLMNMTLDGLEPLLKEKFKGSKINVTRYADDLVVTGDSKELLENEVKATIMDFLKIRGLELSLDKTKVVHISKGFDFLGFNIRKYKGKLLIKPSKESIGSVTHEIKNVINMNKQVRQEILINLLNPIIRGWAYYYCHVVSRRTFSSLDHEMWKMLWQWAKRRHPEKGLRWIKQKYFKFNSKRNWIFSTGNKTLINMSDIPIRRHIKIRMEANPYDQDQEMYFENRWTQLWKKEPYQKRKRLWEIQHGLCPICGQRLHQEEELNIHHQILRTKGGNESLYNLILLHGTCHRQLHANKQERSSMNEEEVDVGIERCLI